MSAGEGFRYLLRTVAVGDGERSLSSPLTRYYTAEGTPPGRWTGSGVAAVAGGRIEVGDQVTESHLHLLIGLGRDPVTAEALGRAFPDYGRPSQIAASVPDTSQPSKQLAPRADTGVRRRPVAGYDFTFSVPKSASVLWAVSDAATQAAIVGAHHAAVADVIAFMEREIAATRTGYSGPEGAVAQVPVDGLIAAAFDHYDSRAGDPHLHTHVVVSNKVRTTLDGGWRSLDGRPLHAATVALSELHESLFADRLSRDFGVGWEQRSRGADRNPGWSVVAVPQAVADAFSSRSRHIEVEKERLIAAYVEAHGRRPSRSTVIRLLQQATLSTRPAKQARSLADLTAEWCRRASALLGKDATDWARTALAGTSDGQRADLVTEATVAKVARSVVAAVGERRSTWRHWNLVAEASRQTRGWRAATPADREALVGRVVEVAERASVRLTPPELASSPPEFQRADGTSVFRPRYSELYSSRELLDAEDRLLASARAASGPRAIAQPQVAGRRSEDPCRGLDAAQRRAVEQIVSSGRRLDLLVGPAGSGKTTTMRALRHVWEHEWGAGSVVGLAPSAAAAKVLAEDLGIETENLAMWWTRHRHGDAPVNDGQLVIVDEASLAGTLTLDRLATAAATGGAKLLLVGDDAQLQAVEAGGAFGMLVGDRTDVPTLSELHRFVHEWERAASLALREGSPEAVDAYLAHDRIHAGTTDDAIDAAYRAWRADRDAGLDTILIAGTRQAAADLNRQAHADLILDGTLRAKGGVSLADGNAAAVGDIVVSRRNDRRLRTGRAWVRNGDRWTVTKVHASGAVSVRAATGRRRSARVTLPAGYVAEHVELGYAVTAHSAQGMTTDTAHALVTRTATRESLYVALTRGRQANSAYVALDQPSDEHSNVHPSDASPTDARGVLLEVLCRRSAERSAHETIADEQARWMNTEQLWAEHDTIAAAANRARATEVIQASGLPAIILESVLTSPAFGALAAEIARMETSGLAAERVLAQVATARELESSDDIAAVLRHRLRDAGAAREVDSGDRERRGAGLRAHGPTADALEERRRLIRELRRTQTVFGNDSYSKLASPALPDRRSEIRRSRDAVLGQ